MNQPAASSCPDLSGNPPVSSTSLHMVSFRTARPAFCWKAEHGAARLQALPCAVAVILTAATRLTREGDSSATDANQTGSSTFTLALSSFCGLPVRLATLAICCKPFCSDPVRRVVGLSPSVGHGLFSYPHISVSPND